MSEKEGENVISSVGGGDLLKKISSKRLNILDFSESINKALYTVKITSSLTHQMGKVKHINPIETVLIFFKDLDSLLDQVNHLISYISTTYSINIEENLLNQFSMEYNEMKMNYQRLRRITKIILFISVILSVILGLILVYQLMLVFFPENTSISFLMVIVEIISFILTLFTMMQLGRYFNRLFPDYSE